MYKCVYYISYRWSYWYLAPISEYAHLNCTSLTNCWSPWCKFCDSSGYAASEEIQPIAVFNSTFFVLIHELQRPWRYDYIFSSKAEFAEEHAYKLFIGFEYGHFAWAANLVAYTSYESIWYILSESYLYVIDLRTMNVTRVNDWGESLRKWKLWFHVE